MKSLSYTIRRTHLYMTLLCLPWFIMYGITALAFNHPKWFSTNDDLYNLNSPNWSKMQTWDCAFDVPDADQIPREFGKKLLHVANIDVDAFSVGRWGGNNIAVYISDVWQIRRLMYDIPSQQLTLYHHTPDLRVFLTLLHSRAGYQHPSMLHDVWAIMVDIVCVGILVWVGSGLYIWWHQRSQRIVGMLGLGLGIATFILFLVVL